MSIDKAKAPQRMSGARRRDPLTVEPSTQPARSGSLQRARVARTKPVRLTIDIDPQLHRQLKRFALDQADDARLADVIRALIAGLEDSAIRDKVLTALDHLH